MSSNEPREGTTDYYAKIGFRADVEKRAHGALQAAVDALSHDDLIRLAEAHGVKRLSAMALEAAAIAIEDMPAPRYPA